MKSVIAVIILLALGNILAKGQSSFVSFYLGVFFGIIALALCIIDNFLIDKEDK